MIEATPFTDYLALGRWLVASMALVVFPGWTLIARHVRSLDFPSRLYLAAGAGTLGNALAAGPCPRRDSLPRPSP